MRNTLLAYLVVFCALVGGHCLNTPQLSIDKSHVHTVMVKDGDSLWSIASRSTPDEVDVREMVYALKEINNLKNVTLTPGMTIKVPAIKSDINRFRVDFDIAQN